MKPSTTNTEMTNSIQLHHARAPLALIATLGLMAWGNCAASANDLFNGELDLTAISSQNGPTPVGWTVEANKTISGAFFDGCSSEPWCNVAPPSDPSGFGVFFKPFQGNLAEGDLLTVDFYQDNATTPGTKFTLSGYAAGEANYSGFFATNTPAPETLFIIYFLNSSSTIIGSNVFNLVSAGLPSGGPGSMTSFRYTTTPEVTAPAGTAIVRAGVSIRNVYGTTGGQSFFVDNLELTSLPPAGSPVITAQPAQTTIAPGGSTNLTVTAVGATSYQWQLYNTNLANGGHFSGVTTPTLTIANASASEVGHYRVLVSNGSGSVYSKDATLALVGLNFYPVVTITGKIGDTYRVDYSTSLSPTTWIPYSTNKLTVSPQLVVDTASPGSNTRFYRAVFLY